MKVSAGHGSSLCIGSCFLPVPWASVGSAPRAALWCESIFILAKMFSFLRYFSYLFADTVSPASPLFLIQMTEVLFMCIIIVRNPQEYMIKIVNRDNKWHIRF